jgi:integrase
MLHMSMGHTGARRLPGAPGLLRVRCSLDEGWLEVRHTLQRATRELAEPKTEQAKRRIAVDEDTVAILRAHRVASLEASLAQPKRRKGADYLFTTREGTPVHARNLLRSFHEALARAGLPRQPFHQLRHGFATLMLEAGEELANVSKVLGHSTYATSVDFYGHLTPTISRRAASRMRDILAG